MVCLKPSSLIGPVIFNVFARSKVFQEYIYVKVLPTKCLLQRGKEK